MPLLTEASPALTAGASIATILGFALALIVAIVPALITIRSAAAVKIAAAAAEARAAAAEKRAEDALKLAGLATAALENMKVLLQASVEFERDEVVRLIADKTRLAVSLARANGSAQ